MSVGGRDFRGSAGFLAGVKGSDSMRQSSAQRTEADENSGCELSAEGILALIERMERATVKELAEGFGGREDRIAPLVDRLEKLELATRVQEGKQIVYSLSDLGRKARKYARIAQPDL